MKKFKVIYKNSVLCEAVIEAETEEEALEIAEEMDGGEFEENPCTGDWTLFGVMEEMGCGK